MSAFRALMHICILLPMLTFGSSLEESGCSSLLWKQPVSCFLMLWSLVAVALKHSRASRLCFMLSRTVGMLQSGTAAWHLCLYLVLFSSMCVSVSLLYWLEQYSIWTHKRVFFTHTNTVCVQPVWALGRLYYYSVFICGTDFHHIKNSYLATLSLHLLKINYTFTYTHIHFVILNKLRNLSVLETT